MDRHRVVETDPYSRFVELGGDVITTFCPAADANRKEVVHMPWGVLGKDQIFRVG